MIDFAEERDRAEIEELFNLCFPEDVYFNEYYFKNFLRCEATLVYRDNGHIVAMLQRLCYKHSQLGEVSYIYGACTEPKYRGKGLMSQLIEFSANYDILEGKKAAVLIPAEEGLFEFYSKFGYKKGFFCGEEALYRNDYKAYPLCNGINVYSADEDNANALAEVYTNSLNLGGISYIERDNSYMSAQIKMYRETGGECLIISEDSKIVGYCFSFAHNDMRVVQEMIVINKSYKDMFIRLIFEKYNVDKIKVITPFGDKPTGCIRVYADMPIKNGYMNLMFN